MARRLLHVKVLDGTDFPGHDEVYVVAELFDIGGRPLRNERAKTKAVPHADTLRWEEPTSLLTLGKRTDLRNLGSLPTLRLSAWAKERIVKDKPLGMATVDIALLPTDGATLEKALVLAPTIDMVQGAACGRIRVELGLDAMQERNIAAASTSGVDASNYVVGLEDGPGFEAEGFADADPNELVVLVKRARGLAAKDVNIGKPNTSDPFVKLQCDDMVKRTKTKKSTLTPVWEEKITFSVMDLSRVLEVEVMDSDFAVDELIGRFAIRIEDLRHKKRITRWYRLLDKDDHYDPDGPLGEVEMSIQWIHNPRVKVRPRRLSLMTRVERTIGLQDSSSDTQEEGEGDAAEDIDADKDAKSTSKQKKDREKQQKDRNDLQKELLDIEIKSGDYTIYVHIIEARDLKAEDLQGTSDPVVYVEAFGQKFATDVKSACLSAVFDETFVISLRNLDKDLFQEGVIRVSVMDADGPAAIKNDLIGSYSFDAAYVYYHKDHELHRQWVALVDDEDPKDTGTQGYLQLSIAIVGPGDKLKVHNEAEDIRLEREKEAASGGIDGMVMVPPSLRTTTQWLVTTVWRAEYLPVMDFGALGRQGGDFFTTVSVSGGAPSRTKKKSMHGNRASLSPTWRTQLWVPTPVPSMSGNVKVTVMDWDPIGENEVVACVTCKLNELQALPGQKHGPRWYPLYGGPLHIPPGVELGEFGKRLTHQMDWRMMYNNVPARASTYRGRILLSREIRAELPHGKEENVPWRRKVSHILPENEPATSRYALRCYVACGEVLPQSVNMLRIGKNHRMGVRISIGERSLDTRFVENEHGVCEWGELLESMDPIVLPADPKQMPDIMVHLIQGSVEQLPICYYRIPAAELLGKGFENVSPKWLLLNEDKVLNNLGPGVYPGSIMVKMALGDLRSFTATSQAWKEEALRLRTRTPYLLRFHIYQGRDFPAADSNGLMDPYLKLQCSSERLDTEKFVVDKKAIYRRRATVDPLYYFTWEADLHLPDVDLQAYFPQLSVQLMDHDNFGDDDYAGRLFINLGSCKVILDQNKIPPVPEPQWRPFFLEAPGDSTGELLISHQLIKTTEAGLTLAPPPRLTPELRPAHLEVLALGIRGMQPYQMLPMEMPYAEMEIDLPNGRKINLTTDPSKKPTGADANFLERLKVPVDLPVRDIFAPRLKLLVRDTRLGGFLTPVVGVGAIELGSKLPWSKNYRPMSAHTLDIKDIMEATGAPVFEDMFDRGEGGPDAAKTQAFSPRGVTASEAADAARRAMFASDSSSASDNGVDYGAGALGVLSFSDASPIKLVKEDEDGAGIEEEKSPGLEVGAGAEHTVGGDDVEDEAASSKVPLEVEMVELMGQEDEGAGVFGAVLHEPDVREKVLSAARQAKLAHGLDEENDGPPKYMIGRKTVAAELEAEFRSTPFETYDLFRGQKTPGDPEASTYRPVGKFKCLVRVTLGDPDDEPLFHRDKKRNEEILGELLMPKRYKMRLYVLQALNLTPMDLGIGGRPGKSDPFLHVKLGKEVFDDQENYIDDVTDADLYKCVELNCELPGASQLQINVMDYDDIGSNDLIGRTVIDLEDRWFDQRWQAWGQENRVVDLMSTDKMRWQTKPVENRSLYVPTSNAPQGVLQCWVDIMHPGDAKGFPMDDVALPPALDFEIRLVIWKCKDVVSMDFLSGLNDLYVKAWVEGCDPQVTDTHWRAKRGKGSFNWRMKFKVQLGPRARATKFPYLTLQMWDKDILKWNDCIAEGVLDMGKHFRRAYKRKKDVLKLFESVRTEKGKMALLKTQTALAQKQAIALKSELDTGIVNPMLGRPERTDPNAPESPATSSTSNMDSGYDEGSGNGAGQQSKSMWGKLDCFGCCDGRTPMTATELREENDRRHTLGMPLVRMEDGMTKKEARKQRKEEGDEEVKELIQKLKVRIGLSTDDPPDSHWVKMEKTNRKTGRKEPMGQCLIGMQIYPAEKAELEPVGNGRTEPNDSPFLPPPTGRLHFTWNPFSMIEQLIGPRLCCILACLSCTAMVMAILIFFQPLWNYIIITANV